eukprot:gnl/MRDRNA2_/MRDRNA2_94194_c0_seq1.p1 gnl/MRDRNA2_/MRDRNA2_94194_c0~~gnl/MRDRNA2_/MRDRNA2_94194_c0_seq1.p1  ORF type:complete len:293 (+),score=43.49 gnl/MRDRNA2_/MRDRNA2_94194_c0_seq1:98-880(+)
MGRVFMESEMVHDLAPEEENPVEQAKMKKQFSKTKMCKFHLLGICEKGTQCPWAHDQAELRKAPDLTKTKLCKTLIMTGRCDQPYCSYAHSREELRSTDAYHKTKICRYWQQGHCILGSKCRFAHCEGQSQQEFQGHNVQEVQESNFNANLESELTRSKFIKNSQANYNIGGDPTVLKPFNDMISGVDDFLIVKLLERIRVLEIEKVMYQRQVAEVLCPELDSSTQYSNVQGLIQYGHGALDAMMGEHRKPPGLETIKAM